MSELGKSDSTMERILLLLLLFIVVPVQAADEDFPRPAGLEPDVAFWTRVYTEVDTNAGLLHDSRNLAVVYQVVRFDPGQSRRSRNAEVAQLKKNYQAILRQLAAGKRENLTEDQQAVLALWPDGVDNRTLQAASRQLRFQLGQSNKFREGYVRSGRWLPYIESVFERRKLPSQLTLLPHVESSFYPGAYSKVGASGMWQFTRSTGRRFMRIDHVVDQRMDPYMATEAAAQLLAYNYEGVGTWPLALTAYNHGLAGMRRAVRQLGGSDPEAIFRRYRGRTFGFASRNFYVAFLAAIDVDANAEHYFGPIERAAPDRSLIIEIDNYHAIDDIAAAYDVSEQTLRALNPALMETVWSGAKHVPKGFPLRVPFSDVSDPQQLLAAIDTAPAYDRQRPDVTHRIRRGETLSAIAAQYGVSTRELVQLNGLRSQHRIRAGQTLRLPVDGQPTVVVAAADTSAAEPTPVAAAAEQEAEPTAEVLAAAIESVAADSTIAESGQSGDVQVTEIEVNDVVLARADATTATPAGVTAVTQEESSDIEAVVTAIGDALLAVDERSEPTLAQDLAADPSDYTVADDGTLEVQAIETLGHYGDWLEIKTQRLRDINGLRFGRPVHVGQRLKLDFSRVDAVQFEQRRREYHREIQENFFRRYRIRDAQAHQIQNGDSIWVLTHRRYEVPLWLLRQYNPDLDIERLRPGSVIQIPLLEAIAADEPMTDVRAQKTAATSP